MIAHMRIPCGYNATALRMPRAGTAAARPVARSQRERLSSGIGSKRRTEEDFQTAPLSVGSWEDSSLPEADQSAAAGKIYLVKWAPTGG